MPGSLTHETRRSSKRRGGKFRRAENSSNHASMQSTHRFLFRSLLVSAKTSNFCDSQTFQIRYSLPSNGCCRNTILMSCATPSLLGAKECVQKGNYEKNNRIKAANSMDLSRGKRLGFFRQKNCHPIIQTNKIKLDFCGFALLP